MSSDAGKKRKTTETWRVVLAGGAIREMVCAVDESGKAWLPESPSTYVVSDDGPREAACMLAAQQRWAVAEVVGPNEMTRAEALSHAAGTTPVVYRDLPAPYHCPACGYVEGLP